MYFLTCRISLKYCLNGVNIQIVLDFITARTLWLHISLHRKKTCIDTEFTTVQIHVEWSASLGRRDGTVVRALTPSPPPPPTTSTTTNVTGVWFRPGATCGLSPLLVLALLWGLFSGFSGFFPPSTKTNISKFQFNQDRQLACMKTP